MLPDRVSNPGPLTYESDALPIALRGPLERDTAFVISSLLPVRRPNIKTGVSLKEKNVFLFRICSQRKICSV